MHTIVLHEKAAGNKTNLIVLLLVYAGTLAAVRPAASYALARAAFWRRRRRRRRRMLSRLAGAARSCSHPLVVLARTTAPERTQRHAEACLLYTSPSPRDMRRSRMPSSA